MHDPIKQQRTPPQAVVVGRSCSDGLLRAVRAEMLARRIETITAADSHCSAKAIIVNPLGQILVLKDTGGEWHDLPGGRVHDGEDAVTGLAREVREETGLSIGDIQLGETINFKAGKVPHTTLLFKATALTLDVRLSAEHSDHAWVEPKDLGNYTLGLLLVPMQRLLSPVAVQAAEGHPFYGNQWTKGNERAWLLVDGNVVRQSEGHEAGASIKHDDVKDAELVHTHPIDVSFSHRDIITLGAAARKGSLKAMSVLTESGKVYRATITKGWTLQEWNGEIRPKLERWNSRHDHGGDTLHRQWLWATTDGPLKGRMTYAVESGQKVQATAHKPIDERTRYANHIAAQNEAEEANRRAVRKALAYAEVAVQEGRAKDEDGKKELLALLLLLLLGGSAAAYAQAHRRMGLEAGNPTPATKAQEEAFAAQRGPLLQPFLTRVVDELELERKRGEALDETAQEMSHRLATTTEQLEERDGERVAQAEGQAAYGSANLRILQTAGYETIAWVTVGDDRVRESHLMCEEQGPIKLGDVFHNGLRFPGDPRGGPEEVVNCRCWLVGVKRRPQAPSGVPPDVYPMAYRIFTG